MTFRALTIWSQSLTVHSQTGCRSVEIWPFPSVKLLSVKKRFGALQHCTIRVSACCHAISACRCSEEADSPGFAESFTPNGSKVSKQRACPFAPDLCSRNPTMIRVGNKLKLLCKLWEENGSVVSVACYWERFIHLALRQSKTLTASDPLLFYCLFVILWLHESQHEIRRLQYEVQYHWNESTLHLCCIRIIF